MKNYNSLAFFYPLLLCLSIFSCQEPSSSSTEQTSGKNKTAQQGEIELLPGEIPYDTAMARVDKYIEVYGETGMQQLTGSNDAVILPRYFIVNSDSIANLMKNHSGSIFASLNVKLRKDTITDPDTSVTNLIFHKVQPNPDGSLKEEPDQFYDYGNACPIDCGGSYPHGGYNGEPVDSTDAVARINSYNNIYGQEEDTVRYLTNTAVQDSILIPRYYSFNKSDIKELLKAMKQYNHQFFYVSVGAVPLIEGGQEVPNAYVSDLIFHYVRPGSGGHLTAAGNVFFDVTRPCPDSCEDLY